MDLEKELKKQKKQLDAIEKNIQTIKRIYFTSLIVKILIIAIPIIGLVLSMPHLVEIYEAVMETITVR